MEDLRYINISKSTATNRCMFVWVGDFYKDSYLRESRYVTKCLLIKTYHSHLKTLRDYIPTLLRDLQIVMHVTHQYFHSKGIILFLSVKEVSRGSLILKLVGVGKCNS